MKPRAPLYPPCEPRRLTTALCETDGVATIRDEAVPLEGTAVRSFATTAVISASGPHPAGSMSAGPPACRQTGGMLPGPQNTADNLGNGLRPERSPAANLRSMHSLTLVQPGVSSMQDKEAAGKEPRIQGPPPVRRGSVHSLSPSRKGPDKSAKKAKKVGEGDTSTHTHPEPAGPPHTKADEPDLYETMHEPEKARALASLLNEMFKCVRSNGTVDSARLGKLVPAAFKFEFMDLDRQCDTLITALTGGSFESLLPYEIAVVRVHSAGPFALPDIVAHLEKLGAVVLPTFSSTECPQNGARWTFSHPAKVRTSPEFKYTPQTMRFAVVRATLPATAFADKGFFTSKKLAYCVEGSHRTKAREFQAGWEHKYHAWFQLDTWNGRFGEMYVAIHKDLSHLSDTVQGGYPLDMEDFPEAPDWFHSWGGLSELGDAATLASISPVRSLQLQARSTLLATYFLTMRVERQEVFALMTTCAEEVSGALNAVMEGGSAPRLPSWAEWLTKNSHQDHAAAAANEHSLMLTAVGMPHTEEKYVGHVPYLSLDRPIMDFTLMNVIEWCVSHGFDWLAAMEEDVAASSEEEGSVAASGNGTNAEYMAQLQDVLDGRKRVQPKLQQYCEFLAKVSEDVFRCWSGQAYTSLNGKEGSYAAVIFASSSAEFNDFVVDMTSAEGSLNALGMERPCIGARIRLDGLVSDIIACSANEAKSYAVMARKWSKNEASFARMQLRTLAADIGMLAITKSKVAPEDLGVVQSDLHKAARAAALTLPEQHQNALTAAPAISAFKYVHFPTEEMHSTFCAAAEIALKCDVRGGSKNAQPANYADSDPEAWNLAKGYCNQEEQHGFLAKHELEGFTPDPSSSQVYGNLLTFFVPVTKVSEIKVKVALEHLRTTRPLEFRVVAAENTTSISTAAKWADKMQNGRAKKAAPSQTLNLKDILRFGKHRGGRGASGAPGAFMKRLKSAARTAGSAAMAQAPQMEPVQTAHLPQSLRNGSQFSPQKIAESIIMNTAAMSGQDIAAVAAGQLAGKVAEVLANPSVALALPGAQRGISQVQAETAKAMMSQSSGLTQAAAQLLASGVSATIDATSTPVQRGTPLDSGTKEAQETSEASAGAAASWQPHPQNSNWMGAGKGKGGGSPHRRGNGHKGGKGGKSFTGGKGGKGFTDDRCLCLLRVVANPKPKGTCSQCDACVTARAAAWPAATAILPAPPSLATFSRVRVYAVNITAPHLPPLPPTPPPFALHLNHNPSNDG